VIVVIITKSVLKASIYTAFRALSLFLTFHFEKNSFSGLPGLKPHKQRIPGFLSLQRRKRFFMVS